jgi:hypothetical protein
MRRSDNVLLIRQGWQQLDRLCPMMRQPGIGTPCPRSLPYWLSAGFSNTQNGKDCKGTKKQETVEADNSNNA